MSSIKDKNGMDLTEAEDIKKRWQEYTEKLYKRDRTDPDNHNDVITHLEPDSLECEVKLALGSTEEENDNPLQVSCLGNPMDKRSLMS